MEKKQIVGVIGGGSWATAIIKMLSENLSYINWWIKNKDSVRHIKTHKHNPKYLSRTKLDLKKLNITSDINDVAEKSDILILAVPSVYLVETMDLINLNIKNKIIISAIKGIVPTKNIVVGEYLNKNLNVPPENIGIITGPCHAEESAMEQLSYLTVAFLNTETSEAFSNLIKCKYVNTIVSDDVYGAEYSSVLKNVIAIAAGICSGLKYGDNFQAVLISNAIREIKKFIDKYRPIHRDINESAYLGDLLVTCYSQYSRNRSFGEMIGRGRPVKKAMSELKMIVEGYYSVKCVHEINKNLGVNMPISTCVYNILYKNGNVKKEVEILTENLN